MQTTSYAAWFTVAPVAAKPTPVMARA